MEAEIQNALLERIREENLIRREWTDRAQVRLDQLTERFLRDLSRLHGDLHELVRDLTGFRIHLANRALEREMRIRSATERIEREMASHILAAERRLLATLKRAAEAESPRSDHQPDAGGPA